MGGGLWVKLPTVVLELGAESVGRVCIYLYLLLLGEQRRLVQRIRSAVLFFLPPSQSWMRPLAVQGCLRWGRAIGTVRVTGDGWGHLGLWKRG